MAHSFTVQISDADYKALCYVTDNPNQYCDDKVTGYILEMVDSVADALVREEFSKPGTRNIPATKEGVIQAATLKTAAQHQADTTAKMERMMIDPDDVDEDADGTGASSMYIPEGI
jgi:hypothetical protein